MVPRIEWDWYVEKDKRLGRIDICAQKFELAQLMKARNGNMFEREHEPIKCLQFIGGQRM